MQPEYTVAPIVIQSILGKRSAFEALNEIGLPKKRLHEHTPVPEIRLSVGLLFKIFRCLEPLDLLHLASTSKSLRNLLMTRNLSLVWKAARENVPHMPDCLPGMSEPQYAYLAFGKDCHFCGKTDNIQIHWHLRIRVCKRCFGDREHFEEKESSKCPARIKRLLPTATASYHPVFSEPPPQYIAKYMRKEWEEKYDRLTHKKQEWLALQLQNRRTYDKLESACWFWSVNLDRYREDERRRKHDRRLHFEERKQEIVKHIQRLGWGDEHSKIPVSGPRPEDSPTVVEACKNSITERSLSILEPFLNQFMQDVRGNRLRNEHTIFLNASLPQLGRIYNSYLSTLPVDALQPSIVTILEDPAVRRVIERAPRIPDSIAAHFDWVTLFRGAIVRWQRSNEEKLATLVGNARGDQLALEPAIALDLATTWFTCSQCHVSLRPRSALLHSCAIQEERSDSDLYTTIVTKVFPNVQSNSLSGISFDLKDRDHMSKVVSMCGFEPKMATAQELNAANPIIECLACNDPREGRAMMKWTKVLDHLRTKHVDGEDLKLDLLVGYEKQTVLEGMDSEQARRMCKLDYRGLFCRHCRLVGNMVDLTKHVKLQHSRPKPTNEDIVPISDESHALDIYWSWPPRNDLP